MRASYTKAITAVLKHEGGYVNHPSDPGGATNRGVTQAVYDAYRRRLGLGVRTVRLIADDEVHAIYRVQYWDAVRGDDLPAGIDYCVFDFAVNSGVNRAVKHLQMALGVKADGVVGQVTLRAAEESDPVVIVNAICDRRMEFLRNLSTFKVFGRGWTSRVSGVRTMAVGLAERLAVPPPPDAPDEHDLPAVEPVRRSTLWDWIKALFSKG